MVITLEKYNNIIEKLKNCVHQFEAMNYQNNSHVLYLANGDTLNIKFFKNSIAHLLGVNIDYLRMANKFKSDMNTFDCLKYFLEESYTFSKLVTEDKKMSFDQMFSPNILKKIDIFINNIKIRTDDLQFMVKYDSEKTYYIEENTDICDYYIIRKNYNGYIVLGLKENDYGIYIPVTSRGYDEFHDFEKFIKRIAVKQDITYPYFMHIKNTSQNFKNDIYARIDEKKVLLDKTIKAAQKYGATPSVARDYSYVIGNVLNSRTKRNEELSVLQLLLDSVKGRSPLDTETIMRVCEITEVSEDIKELVDACNDMMCNASTSENTSLSYSCVINERDKYKSELETLRQQLLEAEEKNKELEASNMQLRNENEIYSIQFNVIEEAIKNTKTKS